MKRQVDLETNIDGDPRGFNTAARAAAEHARRLERENAKLEARLKSLGRQMGASGKSASLMRGELRTLLAGAAALAPAFVAGGAGIVSFGALAVPAIMKVVAAQQDMGDAWAGMTTQQKIAASGLRQLISQYKALADSVEPEVLEAFNAGLGVTSSLLPRLAPLTRSVAKELKAFASEAEDALNSDRADQFFAMLEREAPQAVAAFGDAVGGGAAAVMSLTEALMPLATTGLGVIGMLTRLVAGLADLSPELAQGVVLAMALKGPLGGLGEAATRMQERFKNAGAGVQKTSLATKALNVVTAAGPNLYLAAAAAIAVFGIKAMSAKGSTDRLVDSLRVANRALGNNISGYQQLAAQLTSESSKALKQHDAEYQKVIDSQGALNANTIERAKSAYAAEQASKKLADAAQEEAAKYRTALAGADALAEKYAITREEAVQLATVVGVDLTKGILTNGEITASTAAKFDRYRQAVEMANNPTAVVTEAWKRADNTALGLKERLDALTAALDAYYNPAAGVLAATNRMNDALAESRRVLGDSKASVDDKRRALEGQLGVLAQWAQAEFRAKGNIKESSAALMEQVPMLYKLAGGSRAGTGAIEGLIKSLGGSISKTKEAITITDRFGNVVRVLPSGKVIKISSNTAEGRRRIAELMLYIARQRGTIDVHVRTIYDSPSGRAAILRKNSQADGGVVRYYAQGGEHHVAQIAPAGSWRVWAEPETGGEAYIPMAPGKRRRSEKILSTVAEKFGGAYVRPMADGGVMSGVVNFADGGTTSVPISEYIQAFMGGKGLSKTDYAKVVRSYRDAVDQLRKAERKLAADRKAKKSARTIADDEARVAKERRDLATATERLTIAQARYKKSKLTPAQQLNAGLVLGIKNTSAFIANVNKIADKGFYALASSLLEMGGPEAEKMAAAVAKLSASKLKSLNAKVQTAQRQEAQLAALPNVLKVKAAQKGGARSVAELVRATGLSEDDIAEVFAITGQAKFRRAAGGIDRRAAGGLPPGIATRPVLMGEGTHPEGYVPYDPVYRGKAISLVTRMASDFGIARPAPARNLTAAAGAAGGLTVIANVKVEGALDPLAVARQIETLLSKLVRNNGRTPLTFGVRA